MVGGGHAYVTVGHEIIEVSVSVVVLALDDAGGPQFLVGPANVGGEIKGGSLAGPGPEVGRRINVRVVVAPLLATVGGWVEVIASRLLGVHYLGVGIIARNHGIGRVGLYVGHVPLISARVLGPVFLKCLGLGACYLHHRAMFGRREVERAHLAVVEHSQRAVGVEIRRLDKSECHGVVAVDVVHQYPPVLVYHLVDVWGLAPHGRVVDPARVIVPSSRRAVGGGVLDSGGTVVAHVHQVICVAHLGDIAVDCGLGRVGILEKHLRGGLHTVERLVYIYIIQFGWLVLVAHGQVDHIPPRAVVIDGGRRRGGRTALCCASS